MYRTRTLYYPNVSAHICSFAWIFHGVPIRTQEDKAPLSQVNTGCQSACYKLLCTTEQQPPLPSTARTLHCHLLLSLDLSPMNGAAMH